jgi:hypothetical protein
VIPKTMAALSVKADSMHVRSCIKLSSGGFFQSGAGVLGFAGHRRAAATKRITVRPTFAAASAIGPHPSRFQRQ